MKLDLVSGHEHAGNHSADLHHDIAAGASFIFDHSSLLAAHTAYASDVDVAFGERIGALRPESESSSCPHVLYACGLLWAILHL
jgi:hypothetical protein